MDIETLERQLADAEAALSVLKQEQAGLPAKLQAAAATGDGAALLALRRRLDDLPAHVYGAQIGTWRAEMALLDTEHEATKPELAAAANAVREAAKLVEAAQRDLQAAQIAAGKLSAMIADNRSRFHQLRRNVEDLTHQQTAAGIGPIVRSRPHAAKV